MSATDVLRLLEVVDSLGCRAWVTGGWGVDALAGRQTRVHRDLDLAFDANHEAVVLEALTCLGYILETDWRPVRLELAAGGSARVDLHPVTLDERGDGLQAGLDGRTFSYPSSSLVVGQIAGRPVRCISIAKQLEFHEGYHPRDVDLADLALLATLDRSGRPGAELSCGPGTG